MGVFVTAFLMSALLVTGMGLLFGGHVLDIVLHHPLELVVMIMPVERRADPGGAGSLNP